MFSKTANAVEFIFVLFHGCTTSFFGVGAVDGSPTFLPAANSSSALLGESALLPCRVNNLRDRSVTWMRQRDLHILTAGVFTYSADNRFTVIHEENTNSWNLRISPVTKRDGGVYACQLNSDPKISRRVTLRVIDPTPLENTVIAPTSTVLEPCAEIEGAKERHIQEGSVLSLTCVVRHGPGRAPNHLLWFKGHHPLDYDSPRGGVSVQTEKQPWRTVSKMSVSAVTSRDSGEYTCSPTDLRPYAVLVHVQNGQKHAAIYQGGLNSSCSVALFVPGRRNGNQGSLSPFFQLALSVIAAHQAFTTNLACT